MNYLQTKPRRSNQTLQFRSSHSIAQTDQERSKSKDKKNNSFNYAIKSSNTSICFAILRRFIKESKESILSDISEFSVFVDHSKGQINDILKTIESNANKSGESLAVALSAQQQMSKEREKKMSLLQQKVCEMTEQIKSLTANKVSGARIMQLEAELEDKTRYIEDMEFSYKNKIDDLQLQLNDKTRALSQLKERHYMDIQFQAELDNKNRTINDLILKHKEKVLKLKEKIKNKDELIETLKDFENQTVELKNQLESKSQTISQLESEVQSSQILSNQYETSQEEQKKLKSDILKLKRFAKSLSIEKAKIEKELEKSYEQIKLQKNEISVLNAEKSFAQSQMTRSDVIFSGSPQKVNKKSGFQTPNSKNATFLDKSTDNRPTTNPESNGNNIEDEEMLKTLLKIDRLRLQLNEEKEKTNQCNELVEALKTNLKETQIDNENMKKQLNVIESQMSRKDNRIEKLKHDVTSLNNQIKQKEQLINELLSAENKKSDEIERLHQEIDKLIISQKEIRAKESRDDQNVFKVNKEEYQKLLDMLSQYKKEKLQIEANYKQNQNRAKELETQIETMKRSSSLRDQKITSLTKENIELTTVKEAYSNQVRQIEKELLKQVSDLKSSLEETTKENTELTRQYKDAIQSISTYTTMLDSLRTENSSIKLENSQLQMSIHQQLEPLQSENSRLSESVKKFKEARDLALKEKQQLIIENAQYKAQVEYLTKARKINGQQGIKFDLNLEDASINDIEDRYNEMSDSLTTLMNFLDVKSVAEFQKKWQQNIEEKEDLLSKNKLLEQQTESLKNRLYKFSSKNGDTALNSNNKSSDFHAENQLRKELTQEKKKSGTFQNQTELLQQQISQLENENKDKNNELSELKKTVNKYKIEIDSLHQIIQFESIENLKEEILTILTEKAQGQSTIKELQNSIRKLQNEKSENSMKIEKQQETIETMNISIKELRKENLTTINQLRVENTELQNKFQLADEKKENLMAEINRFHELFNFDKEEDLHFIITSEIEKLKTTIEDSNFKLSQCQNKLNSKESECDFLNRNLNEKKEIINQLKEERNQLKNENFKLSSSVKAAMNDTSSKQLEEIASLLEKENVAEVLPTVSRLLSKQKKNKEKINRLKSEIESLNGQINKVQVTLNETNMAREKIENELSILKFSMSADADSTAKIESKLIEKDKSISDLEEQNRMYIQILAGKEEKIKALENDNLEKNKEIDSIQSKMLLLNASLTENQNLLEQRNSENEALKTENETLKSAVSIVDELREKNQFCQNQLEATKSELIRSQKESENLLKNQSDSFNRINKNNEKERKRLQDKIDQLENIQNNPSFLNSSLDVDDGQIIDLENKKSIFEEEEEDVVDINNDLQNDFVDDQLDDENNNHSSQGKVEIPPDDDLNEDD